MFAHAGRKSEARQILQDLISRGYEHWAAAWALNAIGDLDGAEAMYRSIDSKPGGPQNIMLYATSLYGGKFFHDLDWTPNLAQRLAEASVVEPDRLVIPD